MLHGCFFNGDLAFSGDRKPVLETGDIGLVLDPFRQQLASWMGEQCWMTQAVDRSEQPSLSMIGSPIQAVISAWARLDNRLELADRLGISPAERSALPCSELILRAYWQFGEACPTYLQGEFSFAIYDVEKNKLFCARDRLGARPFYYYSDGTQFAFSSSLTLFHHLEGLSVRPCMEWASRFLIDSLSMDFEKTAYQNIFKLRPGYQCSVSSEGLVLTPYHTFHTVKLQLDSSEAYVAYYRQHLEAAIRSHSEVDHPLGSELSGGIDSSTVTSYAARYFKGSLLDFHTFGFAMEKNGPGYATLVSQQYGLPMTHLCCNPSHFVADTRRHLQAAGAPIEHDSALCHEIFYRLAQHHQVRTLLSGFGGDEFVTSLHGGLYLRELLKNKQYKRLYHSLAGNPVMRALRLVKMIYEGGKNAGLSPVGISQSYAQRWPYFVVKDHLVSAYSIRKDYDAQAHFDQDADNLDEFTLQNRWAPFVTTRMENGMLLAGTYGIEYRWPLLDARLIQCFLSIPSCEKYFRGKGRYLHRRAIVSTVPDAIVAQEGKYMGGITAPVPPEPVLHQDLHPGLHEVIDIPKLIQQATQLTPCSDFSEYWSLERFVVHKNIERVNQLDDWLNYFYPEGVKWANTPA